MNSFCFYNQLIYRRVADSASLKRNIISLGSPCGSLFSFSGINNLSTPAIILNGWPVSTLRVISFSIQAGRQHCLWRDYSELWLKQKDLNFRVYKSKSYILLLYCTPNMWYSRSDSNRDRALIWSLMPGINRLHYRCATGA